MRIAFFGLNKSFDYRQIGGTDSFVRRISTEIVQNGDEVDYVVYGSKRDEEIKVIPGLRMYYFRSWGDALNAIISKGYDHLVEIYIPPWDRIAFMRFRRKHNDSIKFHIVYFGWSDMWLKRYLSFAEARSGTLNGRVFVISPRQYHYVRSCCEEPVLLWPPVPNEYFVSPDTKPNSERLRVSWIGRIDQGKGAKEVVDLFLRLKDNPSVELKICGHHWKTNIKDKVLHDWLMNQDEILYINTEYEEHSPEIEKAIGNLLKQTDVLVLPYRKLSSTIDTPLLLLEAMASLCAVITKPLGNIPSIYGESKFLVPERNFISRVIGLLENISIDEIIKERGRIYKQNLEFNFRSENIANIFLESLKSCRGDK